MKNIIKSIKKSKLTKSLLPLYFWMRYGGKGALWQWSNKAILKLDLKLYKKGHGKSFDWEHPVLFTEKIQHYKYRFKHPDINRITDKVTFKDYITEKIGNGYVIPMYGFWDNMQDMENDWNSDKLPKEFVLKSNLQSNGRSIKIIHDKSKVDFNTLKKEISDWLKIENTLMNSISRHLYWSKPMILAEQYMSNFQNQLYDYKFFCFDGEPFCMYAAIDQFEDGINTDAYPIMFYDLSWKKMDVKYGWHPNNADVPKPKHFDEMLELAKKLSKGFPFLRVDFFDTSEKLYMAELTFDPGGGFTPYYPESFNKRMGELLKFPQ